MNASIDRNRIVAVLRVLFAVLAIVAVVAQFTRSFDDPFLGASNFHALFTNQSNLAAALVLLIGAWRLWRQQPESPGWALVRGAVVTYLATTGIVHAILPTSANETGIEYNYAWASDVLHRVMPVVVLLDWLIVAPAHRLSFRRALVWLTYPLAFCAYSLLRGPLVDWYPYPFIDPREEGGWPGVGIYVVAILAGIMAFGAIIVAIGNAAHQWWAGRSIVDSRSGRHAA